MTDTNDPHFADFTALAEQLPGAKLGNMFGYPCLKSGRKPFAFWSVHAAPAVAFKLGKSPDLPAPVLAAARPFHPKGEGKPMRNWWEVSAAARTDWPELAIQALAYLHNETAR